ncbi:MAG: tyrosine--tRNA ligase [Candidatus Methylacidiphilales bacterium]
MSIHALHCDTKERMFSIQDQLTMLCTGASQIHSREALADKLQSGRPLRVKFGVDPTSPDIHLGHTVPLLKLRQFQDFGHQVILIIGDFTARIGDPSGKNSTRPMLSAEAIKLNARTYEEQAFLVLDRSRTEIIWNGTWFDTMSLMDTLRLMARKTVAQTLQRRDFKERLAAGQDVMMHEIQYPILQGWDSVMVKADVELGGSDQLFNLLMGRDLQEIEGQPPQVVMTMPILEGIDGAEKMSKSLHNYIGVTEPPAEMFGKAMSIGDDLMARWYPVLTGHPLDTTMHPMVAKKNLAGWIVERFHSAEAAVNARQQFEIKFSKKNLDEAEIEEYTVTENPIWIGKLLQDIGAVSSGGDARRLIQQGGVKISGEKCTDPKATIEIQNGMILQAGKKHFRKLKTF